MSNYNDPKFVKVNMNDLIKNKKEDEKLSFDDFLVKLFDDVFKSSNEEENKKEESSKTKEQIENKKFEFNAEDRLTNDEPYFPEINKENEEYWKSVYLKLRCYELEDDCIKRNIVDNAKVVLREQEDYKELQRINLELINIIIDFVKKINI